MIHCYPGREAERADLTTEGMAQGLWIPWYCTMRLSIERAGVLRPAFFKCQHDVQQDCSQEESNAVEGKSLAHVHPMRGRNLDLFQLVEKKERESDSLRAKFMTSLDNFLGALSTQIL